MFSEIENPCPNFHMLSEDKFNYMLPASGTIISIVAHFCLQTPTPWKWVDLLQRLPIYVQVIMCARYCHDGTP